MEEWDDTPDGYFSEDSYNKSKVFAIINSANEALSLEKAFLRYNVTFELQPYNPKGWTHRCCCPLPSHNDQTPSFGFNSKEDRFYCFGCKASGRAVDLIHFMEGTSRLLIAREILAERTIVPTILIKDTSREDERVALIEMSKKIHSFMLVNPSEKRIAFTSSIMWNLEAFILSKKNRHIDLNGLNKRIEILQKWMAAYKEKT